MHWGERDRWKKAWQEEVWGRWQEAKSNYSEILKLLPYRKSELNIAVFSTKPQDEDNTVASMKGVIDGLKHAGLILDDSFDKLRPKVTVIPIRSKEAEHVELTLKMMG